MELFEIQAQIFDDSRIATLVQRLSWMRKSQRGVDLRLTRKGYEWKETQGGANSTVLPTLNFDSDETADPRVLESYITYRYTLDYPDVIRLEAGNKLTAHYYATGDGTAELLDHQAAIEIVPFFLHLGVFTFANFHEDAGLQALALDKFGRMIEKYRELPLALKMMKEILDYHCNASPLRKLLSEVVLKHIAIFKSQPGFKAISAQLPEIVRLVDTVQKGDSDGCDLKLQTRKYEGWRNHGQTT
ncbi:MAG: hypothetical protein M1833_001791 [Piccolia ochrophora]|nr:MAG: hypothetical protein M1833_001791 [Piccolia ochrophora]